MPKGHLHGIWRCQLDLLVEKDLLLDMAEQDFIPAILQYGGTLPGGAGQRRDEPVCPTITDRSSFSPAVDSRLQ